MGSTRWNPVVVIVYVILAGLAVGTAPAQARSASPNRPVTACRVVHEGAVQFCHAVEHRRAIRVIRAKERRQAARAAVSLRISHRPLSWRVGKLWRQNRWERHRLAHLRAMPTSYCVGETGNRLIGCKIVQKRGWSEAEWQMLDWQWTYESGWQVHDPNGLGCDGIPQACPASKLWSRDDARLQILWGLHYIEGRYGSMEAAYAVEQARGYY